MRKNTQKGFTLIELLVVIAIIGILATIVLTSLGSARAKANDAKTEGQLSSMRAQAQLYSTATTPTGQALAASTVTDGGGATIVPAAANGNLFSDATANSNSLAALITGLPSGTVVNYYAAASLPSANGAWAFAAATSTGATCVDGNGVATTTAGTTPTTSAALIASPYFTHLGTGSCN